MIVTCLSLKLYVDCFLIYIVLIWVYPTSTFITSRAYRVSANPRHTPYQRTLLARSVQYRLTVCLYLSDDSVHLHVGSQISNCNSVAKYVGIRINKNVSPTRYFQYLFDNRITYVRSVTSSIDKFYHQFGKFLTQALLKKNCCLSAVHYQIFHLSFIQYRCVSPFFHRVDSISHIT